MDHGEYARARDTVLREISTTVAAVDENDVRKLIDAITGAEAVFFVGVGRVLLALEAFAKRLAHLGIRAIVVGEITEPAITEHDVLIVGSGSGESVVSLAIARRAKEFGATVVHIGANPDSSITAIADQFVRIPTSTKLQLPGEPTSEQPMTSLFDQSLLIIGDVIALLLIQQSGQDLVGLWRNHANLE